MSSREFYALHSISKDPTFIDYVHAIAYIESGFNPKVVSPKQAYGLMQITRVAMMEAAAYCHIPVLRDMTKLLDPILNVKYSTCYLKFLMEQTDTYLGALIMYNGGYRALASYERGSSMPNETAQYVLQVLRVRRMCGSPLPDDVK